MDMQARRVKPWLTGTRPELSLGNSCRPQVLGLHLLLQLLPLVLHPLLLLQHPLSVRKN